MNDPLFPEEFERVEDLDGELPNHAHVDALVVVAFDQLVQVLVQDLEHDALDKEGDTWCFLKTKKSRIFTTPETP